MKRRSFLILTAAQLLAGAAVAQSSPPSLSVRQAYDGAKAGTLILVDIRTPEEWADTGVPVGAIRLDMEASAFEARLAALRLENPGKTIALICRTANRSSSLQRKLAGRGWRDVVDVRGGLLGNPGDKGWLAEQLPVTAYP
ncbi:molybdopterin biosynthesis protein MoeB [Bosea sp. LC85]|uniref:rhodanese-like domain-containing protein n=1 Tax=Bosea sp. LC85 TaxID=1502851 RepID=UPI0004E2EB07|nr:rhodanese-like domain-containing protein [Bosea sp. LC85]KFC73969.1 molybdopterin biosynthesis protein MoeB [Bosea sp. LC85]